MPVKHVDINNPLGDVLEKDDLLIDIKCRIIESKYGSEPEILDIQLYKPDHLDRKFESGTSVMKCGKNFEEYIFTKIVKLQNKRKRNFHK